MSRNSGRRLVAFLTITIVSGSCSTSGSTMPPAGSITTVIHAVEDLVSHGPSPCARCNAELLGVTREQHLADLAENLREATDPDYWKAAGVGIRSEDASHLAVVANLVMQQQVAQALADMRRFSRFASTK